MKYLLCTIFFLLYCSMLPAQKCDTLTFQTFCWNKNNKSTDILKLVAAPSGNLFIVGVADGQQGTNNAGDISVMKTTPGGTPVWSKAIGSFGYDSIDDAKLTRDGGLILSGKTRNSSVYDVGWIVKLDSNGVVQWSKSVGSEVSELTNVVQLSDGAYAAGGFLDIAYSADASGNINAVQKASNIVVKFDENGNTLWWKSFLLGDIDKLLSLAQLQDGQVLLTTDAEYLQPAGDSRYLVKMNEATGDIIWSNLYESDSDHNFNERITEFPDSSLHLHSGNLLYYFDKNGNSLGGVHFDIIDSGYSLDAKDVRYVGTREPGEDFYIASLDVLNPFLFCIKNDSAVISVRQYSGDPGFGKLLYLTSADFQNNIFHFGGSYLTKHFPGLVDNSYIPYIMKTDAEGRTSCSDTFNVPFVFTPFEAGKNYNLQWQQDGILKPGDANIYDVPLEPAILNDCYASDCCRDTLVYRNAGICTGSQYILPDGTVADTAGIYVSVLPTANGCDSIIYTTVSVARPLKVSLGKDTCFTRDNPITYSLSLGDSVNYLWQDGSTDSFYTAIVPGTYWVKVNNACSTASDTTTIFGDCDLPINIPSAFTPNGDGRNDVFRIISMSGQRFINFSIYNRWGQRIFFTTDESKGWDGTINYSPQPSGTYIYLIDYANVKNETTVARGTVVLIR